MLANASYTFSVAPVGDSVDLQLPSSPWGQNLVKGEEQNLASDMVWQKLRSDIVDGYYDAMLAGPPCNTYTDTRRVGDGGPRPLRGPLGADGYGLKDLRPEEQEKVKMGTLLASRTSEAAQEFAKQKKPFVIEQPKWKKDGESVSMYNLDEFEDLIGMEDTKVVDADQCMYAAKTTKPTTLVMQGLEPQQLERRCDHPKTLWVKPSAGEQLWASHPPLVGKEWYIPITQWTTPTCFSANGRSGRSSETSPTSRRRRKLIQDR